MFFKRFWAKTLRAIFFENSSDPDTLRELLKTGLGSFRSGLIVGIFFTNVNTKKIKRSENATVKLNGSRQLFAESCSKGTKMGAMICSISVMAPKVKTNQRKQLSSRAAQIQFRILSSPLTTWSRGICWPIKTTCPKLQNKI